jgi:hypothetical protein
VRSIDPRMTSPAIFSNGGGCIRALKFLSEICNALSLTVTVNSPAIYTYPERLSSLNFSSMLVTFTSPPLVCGVAVEG